LAGNDNKEGAVIVAKGESPIGQVIIVGLTEADIETMRKGLTKVKQGNPLYGFSQLICFMGESDQAMLEMLEQRGTVRNDDLFPDAGSG
jgi:hypothetical protein